MKNYFLKKSNIIQNDIRNKWFNGNMAAFLVNVIVLILIYTVFLQLIGSKPNAINAIGSLTHLSPGMDSWNAMILALTHCKQFPGISVYQELLFNRGIKFQYPPTSLLLFDIPERLTGISYLTIAKVYNVLSWLSIPFTAFFTAKILTTVLEKYNFQTISKSASYILVAVLTVLFYPLIRSYNLGQIQTILTMLVTLMLYFYLCDKKKLAGFCIGLICLVKPQLGVLFVWGAVRREWPMVISGGITVISVLLLSISLYGFHNHYDYLSALSYLSKHGEAFYPNQSVNGLMNRLLFIGNNINWLPNSFPAFNPVVYLTTLFSSIILILSGLFWQYKNGKPNISELSIAILCATMASPIAWEHHYAILLPVFVLHAPFILHFYQNKKWKILLFVLAFVIASQYLAIVNKFANSYLNILQSYLFISAIVILIFLFSVSKRIKKCTI